LAGPDIDSKAAAVTKMLDVAFTLYNLLIDSLLGD
jgi:hypothetical protein